MLCAVAENIRRCRQKYYNLRKVYNSVADFESNVKTQDTINKIPYLPYLRGAGLQIDFNFRPFVCPSVY